MEKSKKIIKELIPDYLDWLEIEKGLSNKSQENYSRFLSKFLLFLKANQMQGLKPHEFTKEHIWKYRLFISRQQKTPLKRSTQNYYLIALRSLLAYFTEKDIASLPPDKIKLPREKSKKTVNFLTLEQIKKLLDAPDTSNNAGLRDKDILETLFSTGLRVAELVALNREQFKLKKGAKYLELGIVGKGNQPRTVYLSERAINWLDNYLETRQDKEKALFINYRGRKPSTRLTVRSIERIVKRYALFAGLPAITSCHTLRHSFATDLLIKGVDIRIVQEFLGHKNIATTQIYTHVTKPHLKEVHGKYHGLKEAPLKEASSDSDDSK